MDNKIALLIKNRISLEEVLAASKDASMHQKTTTFSDRRVKEVRRVACAVASPPRRRI